MLAQGSFEVRHPTPLPFSCASLKERSFGVIFKVLSAQRITVNIYAWSQPKSNTKALQFYFTHILQQGNIPTLSQQSA